MKICITSDGNNLGAQVDPRFGRCQYFIIAELDTLQFEAIKNPNLEASGGAGTQSGQLMMEKQVKTVLTGNCGPNAFQVLKAAGVDVIVGISGTVKEAIERYKSGQLKPIEGPSVGEKFGSGKGV